MDVVKLAPGVSRRLPFSSGSIQLMEARIGIGLQSPGEVLQVLPRMFTSAVFRISEETETPEK